MEPTAEDPSMAAPNRDNLKAELFKDPSQLGAGVVD